MINTNKENFRNDMYQFLRAAVISFYTKCLKSDQKYYKNYLDNGDTIVDYLKFVEDLYLNFYKEK